MQPVHIIPLAERFNQKKWERFNSEKVCHISYARIQGRSSLISHFQVRYRGGGAVMGGGGTASVWPYLDFGPYRNSSRSLILKR